MFFFTFLDSVETNGKTDAFEQKNPKIHIKFTFSFAQISHSADSAKVQKSAKIEVFSQGYPFTKSPKISQNRGFFIGVPLYEKSKNQPKSRFFHSGRFLQFFSHFYHIYAIFGSKIITRGPMAKRTSVLRSRFLANFQSFLPYIRYFWL